MRSSLTCGASASFGFDGPPIKMATRHVEATAEEGSKAAGKVDLAPNQKLIESPMVGTFYRAASPDAPPFVEEGDSAST